MFISIPTLLPTLALLSLSAAPDGALAKSQPKNTILLSDVQSLTLRAGAQTTHRRVSPLPQLKCVSSPAVCRLHEVDVLRCTNQGSGYDAEDIQWSCAASLPPELKLGSTDVICEGYAGPDDPYVLKGSCGVEYRLVLTELGEQKFPDIAHGRGSGGAWFGAGDNKDGGGEDASDLGAWLFGILFVGICVWILYNACYAAAENHRRPVAQRRPRGGGGGGGGGPGFGGGGGGWFDNSSDDPPPPYSGTNPKYSSSSSSAQNQSWRPGFWSGAAAGAAGGYMAANRGNSSSSRQEPSRSSYGGGGSSWGSGPSSSSRSSSSTSSARHESTGFGSTSRR